MEAWFKISFGVVFLAMVAATLPVARRLRQRPEASVDQTKNELPTLRVVRPLLGIVFYGAILDWLLPGFRLGFATFEPPQALRWTGAVLALLAVGLLAWSFESLGTSYRGGVGLWRDHELVTRGPYRWVRHPIYLGFVVVTLGVLLLSANWVAGVSGILLTSSIPVLRLPIEEAELEERFGDRWRGYRARTGAFFPRV